MVNSDRKNNTSADRNYVPFFFYWFINSPGNPAMVALKKSGMRVSEKALELKREELGLNNPLFLPCRL